MRAEARYRPAPDGPASIAGPRTPEELTAEWITGALQSSETLSKGGVAGIEVEQLGRGQGMTGQLARVALQYEQAPPEAPASLIAKFPSTDQATRALTERFRLQEREAGFYRELASRAGMPSPRSYYSDGSVLLLEDLSETHAGDLGAGCTLEEARTLIGHLAKMHAAWWNSPELDRLKWLPTPDDPTTLAYADAVSRDAWNSFRRKAGELPPKLGQLGDRLSRDSSVLSQLGAAPRTLVHGDMRVNNVLWNDDGSVRAIIDWQTVVSGRGPIDSASLFVNGLATEDRRTAERELLPEYHAALVEGGVEGYSFEECWKDYRLAVMNQFSQVVAISSLIDLDAGMDDEVSAATGMRMFAALLELELLELLPPVPLWRRVLGHARSLARA